MVEGHVSDAEWSDQIQARSDQTIAIPESSSRQFGIADIPERLVQTDHHSLTVPTPTSLIDFRPTCRHKPPIRVNQFTRSPPDAGATPLREGSRSGA